MNVEKFAIDKKCFYRKQHELLTTSHLSRSVSQYADNSQLYVYLLVDQPEPTWSPGSLPEVA